LPSYGEIFKANQDCLSICRYINRHFDLWPMRHIMIFSVMREHITIELIEADEQILRYIAGLEKKT
jgi:hypothetical protein